MPTLNIVVACVTILLQAIETVAFDQSRVAAADIRTLSGTRLTLYTDLDGPQIETLPTVFEQAFPQWCQYFGVKEDTLPKWHIIGFLMGDKERFARADLLPERLPPFEHGFSWDNMLWLYEQPSDYYRRHLLLHEGTHGFMNTVFGGCGPPWYMEGIAEHLATHRWHEGRLTLGYMPKDRTETPQWGRIRIIQEAVAAGRTVTLPDLLDYPAAQRVETEFYAWCWAAATLMDRHPRYQHRFRQLIGLVRQPDFNKQFRHLFKSDWHELCEEYQLFTTNIEYGYDVARSAIDFNSAPQKNTSAIDKEHEVTNITIAADRGWQPAGLRLEAGVEYRLTASGRYQVAKTALLSMKDGREVDKDAQKTQIWWCEPNGVSIRYYKGRPLGILLAAVRPDQPPPDGRSALLDPVVVGLSGTIKPTQTGMLFLKINDSPAELDDNAGQLQVAVSTN